MNKELESEMDSLFVENMRKEYMLAGMNAAIEIVMQIRFETISSFNHTIFKDDEVKVQCSTEHAAVMSTLDYVELNLKMLAGQKESDVRAFQVQRDKEELGK